MTVEETLESQRQLLTSPYQRSELLRAAEANLASFSRKLDDWTTFNSLIDQGGKPTLKDARTTTVTVGSKSMALELYPPPPGKIDTEFISSQKGWWERYVEALKSLSAQREAIDSNTMDTVDTVTARAKADFLANKEGWTGKLGEGTMLEMFIDQANRAKARSSQDTVEYQYWNTVSQEAMALKPDTVARVIERENYIRENQDGFSTAQELSDELANGKRFWSNFTYAGVGFAVVAGFLLWRRFSS
jgi:hypothetical protein